MMATNNYISRDNKLSSKIKFSKSLISQCVFIIFFHPLS